MLARVLQSVPDLNEQHHGYFVKALKDELVDTEEVPMPGDSADTCGVGPAPALSQVVPFIAPAAGPEDWTRCVVRLPCKNEHKLYFDNGTHSANAPIRGWYICRPHSIIKYARTRASYREFCAAMYMWAEHAREHPDMPRGDVLDFWPDDVAVQQALLDISLVPF